MNPCMSECSFTSVYARPYVVGGGGGVLGEASAPPKFWKFYSASYVIKPP